MELFEVPQTPATAELNPCIALHGEGPTGTTCKDCVHLHYRPLRSGKRHWKCDLRKVSSGAATDHKVRWNACAKYEERTEEYHGG